MPTSPALSSFLTMKAYDEYRSEPADADAYDDLLVIGQREVTELASKLQDVTEALNNVLLHHGKDMTQGDHASRRLLVNDGQRLYARYLDEIDQDNEDKANQKWESQTMPE